MMMIKAIFAVSAVSLISTASGQVLVIAGVSDGDLSGGNPKAIFLTASTPIADLSDWGVGSANNGEGSDGQEFTFPAISLNTGDAVVVAGNLSTFDFFADNFVPNFQLYQSSAANINGDDAIELFANGTVFDTFGEINVDGTGQSWEYSDGFAVRSGGGPGPFLEANYSFTNDGFDTLTEQQHIDLFVSLGFTAIPEPSSAFLLGLGLVPFLRRRRSRLILPKFS